MSSCYLSAGQALGVSNRLVMRWLAESGGVRPRLCENSVLLGLRSGAGSRRCCRSGWGCERSLVLWVDPLRRSAASWPATVGIGVGTPPRTRSPGPTCAAGGPSRPSWPATRGCSGGAGSVGAGAFAQADRARLRRDFPHDPEMRVTHETIYKALYVQAAASCAATWPNACGPGGPSARPAAAVGERRGPHPGHGQHQPRPAEVADRAVPGHWEGDLIMGSTASNSAIGTLVQRATRFVMLLHLPHGHVATPSPSHGRRR